MRFLWEPEIDVEIKNGESDIFSLIIDGVGELRRATQDCLRILTDTFEGRFKFKAASYGAAVLV